MARKRASMREGPLAELFKATEAAQRQAGRHEPDQPEASTSDQGRAGGGPSPPRQPSSEGVEEPFEETVPPVPDWEAAPAPPPPRLREVEGDEGLPPPVREVPPLREPTYEPPATRWIEPMPDAAPRLQHVPRADTGTYLAM